MDSKSLRDSISAALRYWEPLRLVYNVVLALIVLAYFARNYAHAKAILSVDSVLGLFLLAVLANVAYCAAYPVDIFVRSSGYRDQWQKYRWLIFLIGLLFAGIITRFIAMGMFSSSS